MIPYFKIPPLVIWELEFHAFGILVGIAILVGTYLATERAVRLGLSRRRTNDLVLWMLAGGFVLAHLVAVIFYHPHRIKEDPWVLLEIWNGISSVGGFFGGLLGFLLFMHYYRLPRMLYADAMAYGLSFGWVFGRLGCTTAHDHPGCFTDFPLAVVFPDGVRHDLGFYEFLLALVITAIIFATRRHQERSAPGLHTGLLAVLYGPVRFFLDFLRATDIGKRSDPRYLGLTAAQYGCVLIFAAGVAVLLWRRGKPPWRECLARAGILPDEPRESGEHVDVDEPARVDVPAEEDKPREPGEPVEPAEPAEPTEPEEPDEGPDEAKSST